MSNTIISRTELARLSRAAPFWITFLLPPMAIVSALWGGIWVALVPVMTWYVFVGFDALIGRDTDNGDLEADDHDLKLYIWGTILWVPAQFLTLCWLLWYVPGAAHLSGLEAVLIFLGCGILTGLVGINYSHELMHQSAKIERWAADLLLAMVLYSHFRSEHLIVHHRYVATPRDSVSARYNENFWRFLPRVMRDSLISAFEAEAERLDRKNLPVTDLSNPFWRYGVLQLGMLVLAFVLGGWLGLALFIWQAFIAIMQLELVNYIEHYGLTRKHLGDGKYEHVRPHHSWNADQKASNWLLINLQRHSDHHYKPNRRFPVLQTYSPSEAPLLPYGYPVMGVLAMLPSVWRRVMNPRVRRWREMFYPEITDWTPYTKRTTPLPK